MSSKKTKRAQEEKNSSKEKKQLLSKGKEKRGRNKKGVSENEKKDILKKVENEMNSFKKVIELKEDDFIPYSPEKISEPLNHYNNKISKMSRIYLNKINPELRNKENFLKKFQKIISLMNMNENEFSFFTILLDKIGWICRNEFDIFEHLQYIGLLSMQYLDNKFKNNIEERFKRWKEEVFKKDKEILEKIDKKDIFKRREELTFNNYEFEQDEFLDYNQMADDIIEMSRNYKSQNKT